ncbi:MAG: gliding motility protein GldD [Candidatus Azobacteroides sp.]|nr:gliding motility protein GldD [Candidatus Azobacteroides sp.]
MSIYFFHRIVTKKKYLFPGVIFLCAFLYSCEKEYFPKPKGYFRIELKEKTYVPLPDNYPFTFEIASIASLVEKKEIETDTKENWFDIYYPFYKARIYCSYRAISKEELREVSEDSYRLVFQHTVKADAIEEEIFGYPQERVYGIKYMLSGNTATPVQLIITDSISHFFRASLYFDSTPNQDSLKPVINYINEDINQIINSFKWQE